MPIGVLLWVLSSYPYSIATTKNEIIQVSQVVQVRAEGPKAPGAIRIGGFFCFIHQAAKVLPGGGTIEIRGLVCPNTLTVLTIPEITYIIF